MHPGRSPSILAATSTFYTGGSVGYHPRKVAR